MNNNQSPPLAPLKPTAWREGLGRLAEAIATLEAEPPSPPRAGLSCETCQELLDVYVGDEQQGLNARQRYPAVWRHLAGCDECKEVYDFLVDMLELDLPWIIRLWEMAEDSFRLVFTFGCSHLQSLRFAKPLVTVRDTLTVEPSRHILLYEMVSVAEQTLIVDVTATRRLDKPAWFELQLSITPPPHWGGEGGGRAGQNLRAIVTWAEHTLSAAVDKQGQAYLGQVPLSSLDAETGRFELTLLAGEEVG